MSTLRLKYVQSFTVEGRPFHYFRKKGMRRTALPGLVGSAEFMAAYQAALSAMPVPIGADKRSKPGSISAALVEYFTGQSFRSLSGGTPVKRRLVLEHHLRESHGHRPLASLPKEFLVALLDTMPPHTAINSLKAFRHFFRWCVDRKLMANDPTFGMRLKTPKSDGYHTWTEDEIAQFERAHPIGSKPRLAMALGLFTAQRRGDVLKLGRQHIKDGVLTVRQQKTGANLTIPIHPTLAAIIAATPIDGHLTLLTVRNGKSYDPDDFSNRFRSWCDAAGLPQRCTFHGLRKASCTRLADAGCTAHEIAAISGHKTLKEVERYTKAADQTRLARAAMERIANESVKTQPTEVSNALIQLPKKAG